MIILNEKTANEVNDLNSYVEILKFFKLATDLNNYLYYNVFQISTELSNYFTDEKFTSTIITQITQSWKTYLTINFYNLVDILGIVGDNNLSLALLINKWLSDIDINISSINQIYLDNVEQAISESKIDIQELISKFSRNESKSFSSIDSEVDIGRKVGSPSFGNDGYTNGEEASLFKNAKSIMDNNEIGSLWKSSKNSSTSTSSTSSNSSNSSSNSSNTSKEWMRSLKTLIELFTSNITLKINALY